MKNNSSFSVGQIKSNQEISISGESYYSKNLYGTSKPIFSYKLKNSYVYQDDSTDNHFKLAPKSGILELRVNRQHNVEHVVTPKSAIEIDVQNLRDGYIELGKQRAPEVEVQHKSKKLYLNEAGFKKSQCLNLKSTPSSKRESVFAKSGQTEKLVSNIRLEYLADQIHVSKIESAFQKQNRPDTENMHISTNMIDEASQHVMKFPSYDTTMEDFEIHNLQEMDNKFPKTEFLDETSLSSILTNSSVSDVKDARVDDVPLHQTTKSVATKGTTASNIKIVYLFRSHLRPLISQSSLLRVPKDNYELTFPDTNLLDSTGPTPVLREIVVERRASAELVKEISAQEEELFSSHINEEQLGEIQNLTKVSDKIDYNIVQNLIDKLYTKYNVAIKDYYEVICIDEEESCETLNSQNSEDDREIETIEEEDEYLDTRKTLRKCCKCFSLNKEFQDSNKISSAKLVSDKGDLEDEVLIKTNSCRTKFGARQGESSESYSERPYFKQMYHPHEKTENSTTNELTNESNDSLIETDTCQWKVGDKECRSRTSYSKTVKGVGDNKDIIIKTGKTNRKREGLSVSGTWESKHDENECTAKLSNLGIPKEIYSNYKDANNKNIIVDTDDFARRKKGTYQWKYDDKECKPKKSNPNAGEYSISRKNSGILIKTDTCQWKIGDKACKPKKSYITFFGKFFGSKIKLDDREEKDNNVVKINANDSKSDDKECNAKISNLNDFHNDKMFSPERPTDEECGNVSDSNLNISKPSTLQGTLQGKPFQGSIVPSLQKDLRKLQKFRTLLSELHNILLASNINSNEEFEEINEESYGESRETSESSLVYSACDPNYELSTMSLQGALNLLVSRKRHFSTNEDSLEYISENPQTVKISEQVVDQINNRGGSELVEASSMLQNNIGGGIETRAWQKLFNFTNTVKHSQ